MEKQLSKMISHVALISSDANLKVFEIGLGAISQKTHVSYSGVPLILASGVLAAVPSWWLLDLKKGRHSVDTLDTYSRGMQLWLSALQQNGVLWHEATSGTAQAFIDALTRHGNSGSTVNVRLAPVFAFYKWASARCLIPRIPFSRTSVVLPKHNCKSVVAHSKAEFSEIVAHLPRKLDGARRRDELICECGRYLGFRRKEIVGMTVDQIIRLNAAEEVNVIWTDPAHTKGNKSRAIIIPGLFVGKLKRYVEYYRADVVSGALKAGRRSLPDNLFLTSRGSAVSCAYISDTWKRAANEAEIPSRFHNNRASFATHVADVAEEHGRDPITEVKSLLGHVRESTSKRYVDYTKLRRRILISAHAVNDFYQQEAEERQW